MIEGIVIKSTGSRYLVRDNNNKLYSCTIKGKFRIDGHKTTNPVAVGDHVNFEIKQAENNVITCIQERRNYIIRKSSNLSKLYHIVAANIDQTLLIVTLQAPFTPPEFIDRYLITSEAYSIPAILVFNKIDLYDEALTRQMNELISIYKKIGYTCIKISAKTGENIEEMKTLVKDKITLISGNSGVGKSTLINIIDNTIQLKTGEISDYHQSGKHTTTFAEMFTLANGGYIIDTPGIRGFGIIDFDKEELYHYFPEIFKYADQCRYHNCIHDNEPGCAVKEAFLNGKISETRYRSYLNILLDEDSKYR